MRRSINSLFALAAVVCASVGASAQAGRQPLTISDLLKVQRVGDPQLSPDGRFVAYQIAVPDLDANRNRTQLYLVSVDGGTPRQLTRAASSSTTPRWSPDGRTIYYVTGGQIHALDVQGGRDRQVTNISTGASDEVVSPDGRWLAFVSDVYPDCADDSCNKQRDEAAEANKVKAHVVEGGLLYRHWTAWKDNKRTHVFVVSTDGGAARDMTPGNHDAPPFSLGGPTDYAFSPDSRELAYSSNTDKEGAVSTNNDIFVEPVAGGAANRITGDNRGSDQSPQYSPDGRYIAYRSQLTPGFESDRWRLMLYDRQQNRSRELLANFDNYVDSLIFSADGRYIYFTSGERGRAPVYVVSLADGRASKLLEGDNDELQISRDGQTLVFSRSSATMPTDIYAARLSSPTSVAGGAASGATRLTKENDSFLSGFYLPAPEELTWTGGAGARVSGWFFKPMNYAESGAKVPLVVLIHGGPQGAWNDAWSYRWNPQIYVSQGYAVFLPNPRGSTGYGQRFVNEISGDWGGKVVDDIMNGVATVLSKYNVDRNNIGAAGASYGGYMVDWLLGHNNDRRAHFKTFVVHAGVFNLTSMYGVTEELWFPEWEFKGTPYDNPQLYEKWSPHLYVKNFNTPTLVTQGEIDFRVPVDQGLQLYTALQKRGVESKLVVFPDEGHWILKPQNSRFWYTTVIEWLNRHLKTTT
ncbi:MAG: S9 family peptidase [Acidobacteria bacterium]|nr:S9 family peptidase [Acidobacteriota bacterium]